MQLLMEELHLGRGGEGREGGEGKGRERGEGREGGEGEEGKGRERRERKGTGRERKRLVEGRSVLVMGGADKGRG